MQEDQLSAHPDVPLSVDSDFDAYWRYRQQRGHLRFTPSATATSSPSSHDQQPGNKDCPRR